MKAININILIKAIFNGILTWVLLALFTTAMHTNITLGYALTALPTISSGFAGFFGSYIGYMIRENK